MSGGEVRVLEPGLLTTIQDARGRPGLGRFGVPPGGAMVPTAARLANRLVGNDDDAAVLEMTASGPTLAWTTAAHIGLAGADLGAVADRLPLTVGHSHRMSARSVLRFARSAAGEGTSDEGIRGYLAVAGGFDVPVVLGSASTDRRTGFGGHDGRPLLAGDVVRFVEVAARPLRSQGGAGDRVGGPAPIRVVATPPELGWFAPDATDLLVATAWTVAPASDRNGVRLTGASLPSLAAGIPSLGVPVGSIQVPPAGEPIVTLVDGPVTGGYPVIGVVARPDLDRVGRLGPGATVRFQLVSTDDARAIEPDEPRVEIDAGDDAAGWAV